MGEWGGKAEFRRDGQHGVYEVLGKQELKVGEEKPTWQWEDHKSPLKMGPGFKGTATLSMSTGRNFWYMENQ